LKDKKLSSVDESKIKPVKVNSNSSNYATAPVYANAFYLKITLPKKYSLKQKLLPKNPHSKSKEKYVKKKEHPAATK
jgi:hypothetical protein